jgi:hypothetical protein
VRVAQIGNDEVVGVRIGELGIFQINPPNPEAFLLEPLDKMSTNEPSPTAYQG